MSKRQRGNREAKKPKKASASTKPLAQGGSTPMETGAAPPRLKK